VDLNARAKKRVQMESDLRSALASDEIFLMYQPIVDATQMLTTGFEALARWSKNGKLISPAEFIPLAEKTNLIIPIGEWIMRAACLQCKEWQTKTDRPVFVSVNISPVQFKHNVVIDLVTSVLNETQLDPSCLKIEVTEGMLVENTHKSINTLRAIKDMGVKISIDDFGTGYSSLNYLRQLPVDFLKIDQSFVRKMTTNANDAAIVKTIIDLAHNLNYKVIAEGVETQEQLNFLTTLGCYNIQGYYFSQPLPVAEATAFLQQGRLLR
jgi:EAL domain-containing protein (putative c-di-GMP-specific phosphodiesterase class I)